MHSRIYAERFDLALKKLADAVEKLAERGLVQAEPMPVERDPRILELRRLEYAADVLGQLAENDGLTVVETEVEQLDEPTGEPEGEQPDKPAGESEGEKADEPTGEPKGEVPDEPTGEPEGEVPESAPAEGDSPAVDDIAAMEAEMADEPTGEAEVPKSKRASKAAKAGKEG